MKKYTSVIIKHHNVEIDRLTYQKPKTENQLRRLAVNKVVKADYSRYGINFEYK